MAPLRKALDLNFRASENPSLERLNFRILLKLFLLCLGKTNSPGGVRALMTGQMAWGGAYFLAWEFSPCHRHGLFRTHPPVKFLRAVSLMMSASKERNSLTPIRARSC